MGLHFQYTARFSGVDWIPLELTCGGEERRGRVRSDHGGRGKRSRARSGHVTSAQFLFDVIGSQVEEQKEQRLTVSIIPRHSTVGSKKVKCRVGWIKGRNMKE